MADSPRLRQLQQFLAESPDDAELCYAVAMEFLSLGADDDAIDRFRGLIAEQPSYVPTYLMLGQTLMRLNRDDEAKQVLNDGILAARKSGNDHAQSELQGLLDSLE